MYSPRQTEDKHTEGTTLELIPEYPGTSALDEKHGAYNQDTAAFQIDVNRTRVGDSENLVEEDDEECYERLKEGALFSTTEEDRTHLSKQYSSNGALKLKDASSMNGSSKKTIPPTSTVYSGGAGASGAAKLSSIKYAAHKSGGHYMRKLGSPSRVLGDF